MPSFSQLFHFPSRRRNPTKASEASPGIHRLMYRQWGRCLFRRSLQRATMAEKRGNNGGRASATAAVALLSKRKQSIELLYAVRDRGKVGKSRGKRLTSAAGLRGRILGS